MQSTPKRNKEIPMSTRVYHNGIQVSVKAYLGKGDWVDIRPITEVGLMYTVPASELEYKEDVPIKKDSK
jgi:hypothetical protein